MNEMKEIVNLIKQCLEQNLSPNSFWDNMVEYILPIFSMLIVIVGGFWTVYTYVKGKNKEANQRVLEEVYLPLFQFFVINDSLTQIGDININYKEEPFLVWTSQKTTLKIEEGKTIQTESKTDVMGLSRKSLIEYIEKINLGLSPKNLVALLTSYKAVNYAVETFTGDEQIYRRAIEYRSELEYAIRVEAYKGYKRYHKKLELLNGTTKKVFTIYDDHLQLAIQPCIERSKTYELREEGKDKTTQINEARMKETITFKEKIAYWIIFAISILFSVFVAIKGQSNIYYNIFLLYGNIVLFVTAVFYTCMGNILRNIYDLVLLPLKILTKILGALGIVDTYRHFGKCTLIFFISCVTGFITLACLPNLIPYIGEYVTHSFASSEKAMGMIFFCGFVISMLVSMFVMNRLLKIMVIFITSKDEKGNIDIYSKMWEEVRLVFYLFSIVIRFIKEISGSLGNEFEYFVSAVTFVLLIDTYLDRRKKHLEE